MEQTVLVAETQCSAVAPPVAQMSLSSLAPQPPPKSTPPSPPVLSPHPSLSLSSSSKASSPAATLDVSMQQVDPIALAAVKAWCNAKGNYASVCAELKKNRLIVGKEVDFRLFDKTTVAACVLCNKSFGVFVKKHHCYVCGKVVCDDCSKHRLQGCTECLNWQGACSCAEPKYDSMRMCKRCHSFGGMSSTANALKEGLELSKVAVDTAHRAVSSFGIGIDPASLVRAGCSLSDLQRAGFKTSVLHLKAAGLLAKELKGLGFGAIDLKAEGCFDVRSLKDAGFSCSELVSASLDPQALKSAGFLMSDFIAAGCDCVYLKSCGFNDVSSFKGANFSASSLKSAGFSALELSAAYDLASLQAAAFSTEELRLANFDVSSFKNAGHDAAASQDLSSSASLPVIFSMGFDEDVVRRALANAGGDEQRAVDRIISGQVSSGAGSSISATLTSPTDLYSSVPQNSRIAGGEIVAAHAALLSSPSSSPAQTSARAFARVLFDYEADNAEELTLKVGQFIEVTRDAIHLCNLSRAPTNFSRRLRRKTKVVGRKAKSMEKRCAPVHAFVLFSRLF
jgi:hypothetical protein